MKGVVFTDFFEFIEAEHDYAMVDKVIEASGSNGIYTAVGSYPFEEMLNLVVAYGEHSKTEITDILYKFGKHLLRTFYTNYSFFFTQSRTAFDFLNSVDSYIHIEVAKLYPDAELPRFSVVHRDEKQMVLIYNSERKLSHLALGLIEETLSYYKEKAHVDMLNLSEDGSEVKFTLTKV